MLPSYIRSERHLSHTPSQSAHLGSQHCCCQFTLGSTAGSAQYSRQCTAQQAVHSNSRQCTVQQAVHSNRRSVLGTLNGLTQCSSHRRPSAVHHRGGQIRHALHVPSGVHLPSAQAAYSIDQSRTYQSRIYQWQQQPAASSQQPANSSEQPAAASSQYWQAASSQQAALGSRQQRAVLGSSQQQ